MAERRMRPAVRRALIAAAVLALVGGAAYGSTYTSLFSADEVRVEGVVRIAPDAVRQLGGLSVGTNVFHLDASAAEERLRRDPRIAAVEVITDLPDRITIRVVERVPVAMVEVDGAATVVADDGVLLPGAGSDVLPEIRAVVGELDDDHRAGAAGALGAMAPMVRRSVEVVNVSSGGELLLETADGVTVTYGLASEPDAKAVALRAVLEWARGANLDLVAINVTVPAAPTARTADGTVTSI